MKGENVKESERGKDGERERVREKERVRAHSSENKCVQVPECQRASK